MQKITISYIKKRSNAKSCVEVQNRPVKVPIAVSGTKFKLPYTNTQMQTKTTFAPLTTSISYRNPRLIVTELKTKQRLEIDKCHHTVQNCLDGTNLSISRTQQLKSFVRRLTFSDAVHNSRLRLETTKTADRHGLLLGNLRTRPRRALHLAARNRRSPADLGSAVEEGYGGEGREEDRPPPHQRPSPAPPALATHPRPRSARLIVGAGGGHGDSGSDDR